MFLVQLSCRSGWSLLCTFWVQPYWPSVFLIYPYDFYSSMCGMVLNSFCHSNFFINVCYCFVCRKFYKYCSMFIFDTGIFCVIVAQFLLKLFHMPLWLVFLQISLILYSPCLRLFCHLAIPCLPFPSNFSLRGDSNLYLFLMVILSLDDFICYSWSMSIW